jgi:hypothetical protein
MLAVDRGRRVGVADIAAGTVAGPAAAVVPAARVLRHVAANRSLISDLRRGYVLGRFHQNRILLANDRVLDDFGERRHRADLDAAIRLADAAQLLDLAEVDDNLRLLEAVLQPVHAVQTAGEHQRVGLVLIEQPEGIVDRRRLIKLEDRHYVAYYGHVVLLVAGLNGPPYTFTDAPSAVRASVFRRSRAPSTEYPPTPVTSGTPRRQLRRRSRS